MGIPPAAPPPPPARPPAGENRLGSQGFMSAPTVAGTTPSVLPSSLSPVRTLSDEMISACGGHLPPVLIMLRGAPTQIHRDLGHWQ